MMFTLSAISVFAADENPTPDGVKTDTMDGLVSLVFWIVRGIILVVAVVPSLIKAAQGKAEENPRDMQSGISSVIIVGIIFVTTVTKTVKTTCTYTDTLTITPGTTGATNQYKWYYTYEYDIDGTHYIQTIGVDTWTMGLSSYAVSTLYLEYDADHPITKFWEAYSKANEAVHSGTDYTTPYIDLVNAWTTVKALNLGGNVPFITDAANALITWWSEMLSGIQNLFTDFDTGFDMQGFIDTFAVAEGVITIFASSLVALFFAVNLLENAIQYQLLTLKGFVNIVGRLLLAETWVNLSVQICMMVIQIFNELTSSLVSVISSSGLLDGVSLTFQASKSNMWLVGDLVDFFNNLIPLLVFSAIILFLLGVWGASYIKLTIRSIQLGMMTILSPAFFACLTGETTKPYFRKFLLTFIGTVAEILFMSLVFGAYCYWLGQNMTDVGLIVKVEDLYAFNDSAKTYIQYVVMTLACGIMMVKPPAVLKNLVNG